MFLGMPTYKASNSIGHEKYLSYTERVREGKDHTRLLEVVSMPIAQEIP